MRKFVPGLAAKSRLQRHLYSECIYAQLYLEKGGGNMFAEDLYVAESIMFQRVEERLQEAKSRALVHQVRSRQRGVLSRSGCQLMCQLGRFLVALGQRMERRYALQQIPAFGEHASGS
jgi:hypothetical protein